MKKTKHILFILLLFSLNACIKENDVFENNIVNPQEITETSLIVSFLNEEFLTNSVDTETCFTFNYPITISNNIGQQLITENFAALQEIAISQSSNFIITGIIFPISITNNDNSVSTINNIEELHTAFDFCGVPSLRSTLFNKTDECLIIEYPFEMFDVNDEAQVIENKDEFYRFLNAGDESGITPKFVFPIRIQDNTVITNYFSLYDILNDCELTEEITIIPENCLDNDINITAIELGTNLFEFTIESEGINYSEITWSINDIEIPDENTLTFQNEFTLDGIYDVCATTIIEGCPVETTTQVCSNPIEISIND